MDARRARQATGRRGARDFRLRPKASEQLLGHFHEISLETADIRASVEFYERLGFSQATTGDTWSHPYGVLTDGRLFLGLHQRRSPSPALTFVHPEVAGLAPELEARGIPLTLCHTGTDLFNQIGFRDPFGQAVSVLEARTFSPVARRSSQTSLCGYFDEISMPASNLQAARDFWERLGFVATDESDVPYLHLPLTSDHLNIAFHRPRTLDEPMLVFSDSDMPARLARLRELDISFSDHLPRGLDNSENALLESPEGTLLLLLKAAES
jgi:catechol 2,3-dioxygenase-like lactoylglutathione lyase family enzyme